MGHILIIYHSKDGNTKKMADIVAEGAKEIDGIEVIEKSISETSKNDIYWADGIAVGSPTHLGTISAEMNEFWERLQPAWQKIDGKIGCAFSSEGGWGGGAELTCQTLLTIMINYGFLVFGVPDYSGKQFTAHYGATQAGEPREEKEIMSCKRLGRRLAEWISVYVDRRLENHPLNCSYKRQ